MLVYTPKGNIPIVGNFLRQNKLHLEHPSPNDVHRYANYHYFNPHNPPGGHNFIMQGPDRPNLPIPLAQRWAAPIPASKSIEVQRSQIDELFKNLKTGDELAETEPRTIHLALPFQTDFFFSSIGCGNHVVSSPEESPDFFTGTRARTPRQRRPVF